MHTSSWSVPLMVADDVPRYEDFQRLLLVLWRMQNHHHHHQAQFLIHLNPSLHHLNQIQHQIVNPWPGSQLLHHPLRMYLNRCHLLLPTRAPQSVRPQTPNSHNGETQITTHTSVSSVSSSLEEYAMSSLLYNT